MKTFSTVSEGPRYSYNRHPLHPRAFQILKRTGQARDTQPVGDYTVLDLSEDLGLAERKVINLVALLNGRENNLMDVGDGLDTRLLYQRIPSDDGQERIMFRTLGYSGVSVENALLTLRDEGVQL